MVMKWMKNVDTGTDIYRKWQENWLKWEPSRGWGFVRLASVPHLNFSGFSARPAPGFSTEWNFVHPTPREGDARCREDARRRVSLLWQFFSMRRWNFFFLTPVRLLRKGRSVRVIFHSFRPECGTWTLAVTPLAVGRHVTLWRGPKSHRWGLDGMKASRVFGGEDQTLSWYRQITGRTGRLMFAADAARRRWRRGAVHFFFFFRLQLFFYFFSEGKRMR